MIFAGGRGEPERPVPSVVSDAGTARTTADVGVADTREDVAFAQWMAPDLGEGNFAAVRDGTRLSCDFVVGAAGVYPPLSHQGNSVALPQPSPGMRAEEVETVEVLARCEDGRSGFWADVPWTATERPVEPVRVVRVSVVDENGEPVRGAQVRLARRSLGLVVLKQNTDEAGIAEFAGIAASTELTASASAPGKKGAHDAVGPTTRLVLAPGSKITGRVVTQGGGPVAEATVAVYTDTSVDALPAAIVASGDDGRFTAERLPGTAVSVTAFAVGYAPKRRAVNELEGNVTIELARGRTVDALVTTDSGSVLAGAKVRWRDENTSWGSAEVADRAGKARLRGVPPNASIWAEYREATSSRVLAADAPDGPLTLVVRRADLRSWRLRLPMADDVELITLRATDGLGASCLVEAVDERDYMLSMCGDGRLQLHASTNRGRVAWDAGPFDKAMESTIPPTAKLTVDVRGDPDEDWEHTSFAIAGPVAQLLPVDVSEQPDGSRRLTARIYSGRWELVAENNRIARQRFQIPLDSDAETFRVELTRQTTISVNVIDDRRAPITGAHVLLFQGERLVDVRRSAGQLPSEFRVRPPFHGLVLAVDPRRGEGLVSLDFKDFVQPQRVVVKQPVLSIAKPSSRVTQDELSDRLGVELVRFDAGFALEPSSGSAAISAGLRRGDLLVTAWREGDNLRVLVDRRGTLIDATVE